MDKLKRKDSTGLKPFQFQTTWLFLLCSMVILSKAMADNSDGYSPSSNQGNYSYPTDSSSQGFVPSETVEEPVFASRSHSSPIHHRPHLHHEHPPGVGDKVGKGLLSDSKALSIEKSPPELQFGLSFTVPFLSMSTERLLNTLSGKSFSDPYTDVASLLKLNVGGLILAAVVGLAALFFVPSLLPGKLPGLFSQGFPHGFMPAVFDQLVPGLGLNKPFGYGQYDHPYDPYSGDYSSSGSYNQRNQENFDNRGRALKRDAKNGTVYSELFSTVQKAVSSYWGEVEACASHAMCLKGKEIIEEKHKKSEENKKNRHSRRPDDPSDPESLSSFEHVLEAIHGMKGITKNMPVFHELHKAYKSGQNGADCSSEFKKCPVTADRISKTLNNMGNYIFNN